MRNWFRSRNGAVTLGVIAFLTLLARVTFLDALFVADVRNMLPSNQPLKLTLVMLVYMVFIGVWVWSVLVAARGSQAGLTALMILSLLVGLGGGLLTLTVFCSNRCAAWPVGNVIVWVNLISGLLASVALGSELWQVRRESGRIQQAAKGGAS